MKSAAVEADNAAGPCWPFDQAADVAAITTAHVLEEQAPILLVVHYSDDASWAFLDGSPLSTDASRVISMGEALAIDPSLREVADLPPGWVAKRSDLNGAWVRCESDEA